MKFTTLTGRVKYKNISNRKINWDKPSRSKMQTTVKNFLAPFWQYDQVYEEMPVLGTRNTLDIVNITKGIAIEVHGVQHSKFSPFFHRTRNDFRSQLERDMSKEKWCEINNLKYIDIYDKDLKLLSKEWFLETFSINL
jgi:hypothetical protein